MITKSLVDCPRGQWKVCEVNGTITVHLGKPTFPDILAALNATLFDQVVLRKPNGEWDGTTMLVDDDGLNKRLPVNEKATEVYRARTGAAVGTIIVGVAVIINDHDFATPDD